MKTGAYIYIETTGPIVTIYLPNFPHRFQPIHWAELGGSPLFFLLEIMNLK